MPGRFAQSYWISLAQWMVSMKLMGSRKLLSLWVAVFAFVWSTLGAVCEEVALFSKAAKFVVLQERVGFLRFLVIS